MRGSSATIVEGRSSSSITRSVGTRTGSTRAPSVPSSPCPRRSA